MANPAELLHAQLFEWRSEGSLQSIRSLPNAEGWEKMRIAVLNLNNVVTMLNRLESEGHNVESFRAYLPELNKSVFGWGVPWTGSSRSDGGVDVHALNNLHALSTLLDIYVPKLAEGGLQTLIDAMQSELLDIPTEALPFELVTYFQRCRKHLEWCIQHFDEVGEFELSEAAMQFKMTVLFMAATSTDEETSSNLWTFVKDKFGWPFVTTAVTQIPAAKASGVLDAGISQLMELTMKAFGG